MILVSYLNKIYITLSDPETTKRLADRNAYGKDSTQTLNEGLLLIKKVATK